MPVTYDRNSFLIDGQRIFLTSGSLHYFRIPRALWRSRLEQARAAGLNAIQFYVAWNWHEAEPGQFDFTGERDLDHFMTLAEELGLYLVARPGPYICAEWDFGGLPPWLMQTAGIRLRHYDPLYLRHVDRYFEQTLPLIARHQSDRSERNGRKGGVILVQAENELGIVSAEDGALTMRHLVQLYRRLGITVPIITCEGGAEGTIECVNAHAPADRFAAMRRKQPDTPLHCTEFWPGWYCTWDRAEEAYPRSPAVVERETWRVLAHGGAGYNYYMWHGGTHFGYTSMYLNTTAYYPIAPLSEAGGIWEKYRRCRRVACFAQTFADILTTARPGDFSDIERDTTLGADFFQRVSERGKILFIENPNPTRVGIYVNVNYTRQDVFVPGEAVRPVVYDAPLGGKTALAFCTAGVLGRWIDAECTQLVVYGDPGVTNRAIVAIWVPGVNEPLVKGDLVAEWREREARDGTVIVSPIGPADAEEQAMMEEVDRLLAELDEPDLLPNEESDLLNTLQDEPPLPAPAYEPGGVLTFTISFTEAPQTAEFTVEGHTIRLLALPTGLADRTWWQPEEQRPTLFIGAHTAQFPSDGTLRLGLNEGETRLWRYAEGSLEALPTPAEAILPAPPALSDWMYYDGEIESAEDYDDSHAIGMYAPINRVLLDAQAGYAWYRTAFDSAVERDATLTFSAFADRILVFLNGAFITSTFPPAEDRVADPSLTVNVRLRAGRNVLAVLTDNLGHVKGEWQFRGRPMEQDKKGLFGDVLLDYSRVLHHWRFLPGLTAERGPEGKARRAGVTFQVHGPQPGDGWTWRPAAEAPPDKRLRWLRATFRLSAEELAFPGRELRLDLTGMGKGVFWANGTNLGRYWIINGHTSYYVPKCWLAEENVITVFEEENRDPSSVHLVWDTDARVATWIETQHQGVDGSA
jgi:hypothetical protein